MNIYYEHIKCSRCGSLIRVCENTSTDYSGNTRNSYTCNSCHTTVVVKTLCPEEDFHDPAKAIYKRKHCSGCHGSGYDRTGKPCRKCR